jgi:hypothetical protein
LLVAGPPFCTGYAYHAWRRAQGSALAAAGLVVALLELLALAGLVLLAVLTAA